MADMIPFIDLQAQRLRLKDQIDTAVADVIASGRYILGPEVRELETRLSDFIGGGHCLACANGTDAILLPLMGWGIGPGDAVFVPSFTFAATAEVVALTGATPVFVDIDAETFNLSADSLSAAIDMIKSDGTLKPRAVIAVDLFGQPADYPKLAEIVRAHDLKFVSDCAQAYGSDIDGKSALNWVDALTVSFYPAKPLGCYGDGGAVLTNDEDLLKAMQSLHVHGEGETRYEYARIGINSRLDTIQAAILLAKLDVFRDEIAMRQRVADQYQDKLAQYVAVPVVKPGYQSTWAQYTVQVDNRDDFRAALADKGVPTAVYYPIPLHKQPPYQAYPVAPGGLPVTEAVADRVVSLPMYPDMPVAHIEQVAEAVIAAKNATD